MTYDVLVVGAGPAGAALSSFLAGKGAKVLCVDKAKFPRRKVCGEFISPEARCTLAALCILEELNQAAPITGFRLVGPRGKRWEGDFPPVSAGHEAALGFSRWSLDALLISKARHAGAQVEEGFTVTGLKGRPGAWTLEGRSRTSQQPLRLEANWLVGADGQHSLVRRKLPGASAPRTTRRPDLFGFKAHFQNLPLDGRVELDFFPGGYVGSNPVETGGANVCFLFRGKGRGSVPRTEAEIDRYLSGLCSQSSSLRERLSGGMRCSPWSRTGKLRFGAGRVCAGGALFVGDAAGAIDPFAGDGISMALRGAEILASFLATGAEDLERRVFQGYPSAWAAEFGRRMRWAASLRTLLRIPALPDLVLQTLSKSPNLGQRFVEATRSPLPAQRALQNGVNPSSRRPF